MLSQSRKLIIVFNGEIYNFKFLKDYLKKNFNVSFIGSSDTEVLLMLIEKLGLKEALEMTQGMFALAVFDKRNNSIHLCRDRIGEKPLYYALIGNSLFFSSELKPIIKTLKNQLTLDRDNINFFIHKSYFPEGSSVFKEVKKIVPGTINSFFFENGNIVKTKTTTYWSFEEEVDNSLLALQTDYTDSKHYLNDLLERKVKERMISDVPLGAFLSGGYDSSLIVALMQQNNSERIKTFSIGFDAPEYNEAIYAKEIASYLGTEHTELYITDKELLETIYKIPTIYSEPFADSSQIPTILLSNLTKTQVTVSLSGDGGDEIFGGYGRYFLGQRIVNTLGRVPYSLRSFIRKTRLLDNSLSKFFLHLLIGKSVTNFPQKFQKLNKIFDFKGETDLYEKLSTFENKFLPNNLQSPLFNKNIWSKDLSYAEKAMMQDTVDYLPGDILRKVDLAAMSTSLETRIPFLDHEIIAYAWSLPFDYKFRNSSGKYILKDVAHSHIPQTLLDRPKKGFDIPLNLILEMN